jgi:RNA polymerase subunit RPABC4/transcription elongation factor Spt4
MNYETQKQVSGADFSCAFCGYWSKLDLTECPNCGRLKRNDKRKTGAPPDTPLRAETKGFDEAFARALPVAESLLYVCENCRYQTPRKLGECPECGRRKFAAFAVPANGANRANFRVKPVSINKPEIGKVLLVFGGSFLFVALLVFIGYGPAGRNRHTELIANVGENWHIAGIVCLIGIGLLIGGIILKNMD